MNRNRKIGNNGEKLAAEYLIQEGYEIVALNWRNGHKEIDIIARKETIFIFIEVKTRKTKRQGFPEESISASKINSVTEAARIFLEDKSYTDVRFDVIAIFQPSKDKTDFLHIKDAFY